MWITKVELVFIPGKFILKALVRGLERAYDGYISSDSF